jgi:hypothetical protein
MPQPTNAAVERQLGGFLAKYAPPVARDARVARRWLRQRLPGAVEFVYDNYNALVIGFGPTDRPSEAVFSIVLSPRWVTLVFLEGVLLSDPDGLLRGEGKQVRSIRLDDVGTLKQPAVQALIDQAVANAVPFNPRQRRRVLLRAVVKKHRPRRPSSRSRR